MRKIRITHHCDANWYKTGETYIVRDERKYEGIGVQVVKNGNGVTPDVVFDGDYEYI